MSARVTARIGRELPGVRGLTRTAATALRRWAWILWIALAMPGLLTYFLVPGMDQDAMYTLFGSLAVLGMLAGTLLHDAATKGWWRVAALGIGLYVLGDVVYTRLAAMGEASVPSLADVSYLTGFVIFAVAIARLVEPSRRVGLRAAILDAAIVATCVGILVWRVIIQPLTEFAVNPVTAAVAMAYPMLDVLLAFVLLLHLFAGGRKTPSLWLLTFGVVTFLASDLVYTSMSIDGSYEMGMLVDAGWLIGYVLFAAATLHPTMYNLAVIEDAMDPISNRRIGLLVVVISIAGMAIALSPVERQSQVIGVIVAASVLLALGLLRFAGSLIDTRSLLSEANELRDRMVKAARTDELTGLPNRAGFTETMRAALEQPGSRAAILYLDLDQFRAINDAWGYSTGDELLILAAERLRETIDMSQDVVARFGGDEFSVLILNATNPDDCVGLADRVLARFGEPFVISGVSMAIHPSIGIAVGEPGDDDIRLLRRADLAMYDAKRRGGGRWSVFEQAHERVLERYRLANELGASIEADELVVHYQPLCDLDTGNLVGLEALVRWQHPVHGLLSPGSFIPVAESAGLIGRLDIWVLGAALKQLRTWIDVDLWTPERRLHVNFAASDLEDPSIVGQIAAALREAGVPPAALSVEVTESELLEGERTRRHLQEIAGLGVSLSLDDFGTRYAVIATLADLPFTTLKIDRSFVTELESAPRARLFEGVVRLAERLGLETLAEGIETEAQRAMVRKLGCRLGQGYLLGRPVPAAEVEEALARTAAPQATGST